MLYSFLLAIFMFLFIFVYFIKLFLFKFPKKFHFPGSHVLITGGSSGIGRSLAEQAFKLGANVTLLARDVEKLAETQKYLLEHSKTNKKNTVQYFSVDISRNYDEVNDIIKQAESKLGPVDVLINSAGFSVAGSLEDLHVDQFKKLMDLNYLGSVHCTKAVIGQMKARRRGRIVLISSQAGQVGLYGYSAYSGSKFALRGFAESLQMEVLPYNVHVCLAFPPDTKTPGYDEEMKNKPLETKLISESSGLHDSSDVAKKIIQGIVDGTFSIYIGLEGFFMNHLTAGFSPTTNLTDTFIQVFSMGLLRMVSVIYLSTFNKIVRNCAVNKKLL
ncbi:hypothetical protein HELRODRAFT_104089 [Helobdella robusta]|uniref:3-dehydrosphinganine reductase n=1 Tax=Helobdella robusta TaxID=6412 RepID=T1EDJ6_HELRO|nr:hypothetical protein HELRODRAFT_104089 [Helobdella robusta]ESN91947.1 hypothetical protein HELRODRAFT_104089 [Helobdella robusta]